jgi:hypothetical protein
LEREWVRVEEDVVVGENCNYSKPINYLLANKRE